MFNADRIIAASEAGRRCVRCGTAVHVSDGAHLCRDLRGRLNAYRNDRRQHLLSLIRKGIA